MFRNTRVVEYINLIADTIRNEQAFEIEGRTFTSDDFPPGFWRQLAKEVNHLHSLDTASQSVGTTAT